MRAPFDTGMVQKGTVMISALSGAGSRALLSLFGRPKSQGPADDLSQLAGASAGPGVAPDTLFASMVDQAGAPDDLAAKAVAALDRDRSGTLNTDELSQAFQSVASSGTLSSVAGLVQNILAQVDTDGDGAVSGTELSAAVAGLTKGGSTDDAGLNRLLQQTMGALDADGDGKVTGAEAAQSLGLATNALPAASPGIDARPATAPKSMYEAIFSMRVNPGGGEDSAQAREAISTRLRDQLMG